MTPFYTFKLYENTQHTHTHTQKTSTRIILETQGKSYINYVLDYRT